MRLRLLLVCTVRYGLTLAGFVVSLASIGCGRADLLPTEDPSRMTIQLRSSAFDDGGMIPKIFTCDSSDSSPPLAWSGVPPAAHSLAVIVDDPDAPMGTWSHWVVFNLPPQVTALKQAVPPAQTIEPAFLENLGSSSENRLAVVQGRNDFGKNGYGGPCPPSSTHRYFFRLYALDNELQLNSEATRADLLKQISRHILAEGRLVGKLPTAVSCSREALYPSRRSSLSGMITALPIPHRWRHCLPLRSVLMILPLPSLNTFASSISLAAQ